MWILNWKILFTAKFQQLQFQVINCNSDHHSDLKKWKCFSVFILLWFCPLTLVKGTCITESLWVRYLRRGEECKYLNFRLLFPDYFSLWNNLKIHPRSLKSLRANFWFLILILINIFLLICFQERCFLPNPANYLSRFRNSFCMSEVAFWLRSVFYLPAFSLLATCCLVGFF